MIAIIYKLVRQCVIVLLIAILMPSLTAQQANQEEKTQHHQLGLPIIQNYTPDGYRGHHQNFGITQDERGIIYVANANGVLEYDGSQWRMIRLPGNQAAFSIFADQDKIFIGAYGDFGYLETNEQGFYEYQSLLGEVDSSFQDFKQVWYIKKTGQQIYFHSNDALHRLAKDGSITSWQFENRIADIFAISGNVYGQVLDEGLAKFEQEGFTWLDTSDHWKKIRIMDSESIDEDNVLCLTLGRGLFNYGKNGLESMSTEADKFLRNGNFYNLEILRNGYLAVVGVEGLIILSQNGKWVYSLDHEDGLIGNFGHNLFQDAQNALWIATNVGISRVEISSPYTIFDDRNGLDGYVNTIHIFDDMVYVADHVGLAKLEHELITGPTNKFTRLTTPDMQGLHFLDTEIGLLAATRNGIQLIKDEHVRLVSELRSGSLTQSKIDSNLVYVGLFNGFSTLRKANNTWVLERKFSEPNNDIRTIVEDKQGSLWMEPQNGGIYKVDMNGDSVQVKYFKSGIELPADYVYLYEYQGEALIQSEKVVYTYDEGLDSFIRNQEIHDFFNNGNGVEPLLGFSEENIIYEVTDPQTDEVILLSGFVNNGNLILDTLDIARISDRTLFRKVLRDDDGVFWYAGRDGVARHDTRLALNRNHGLSALIRKIAVNQDSLIYGGHGPLLQNSIDYGADLRIEYSLPSYDSETANLFQYYLDGYDEDWSGWTEESSKDYTRIPEGKYSFRVRGKNIYDQISEEAVLQFSVSPPWYRSWWAYSFYLLLGCALLYTLVEWRSAKLIRDREKLKYLVETRTDELKQKNRTLHTQKQELQDKTNQLDKLINFKSKFFTQISHDFRTPITVINGLASRIIDRDKEVRGIMRNSNSLLNLVDQIIEFNKLDSDELAVHLEQIDVIYALKQVFLNFQEFALSQNKNLIWDSVDYQLIMDTDQKYLYRIVSNLLSNALKFSQPSDTIRLSLGQENNNFKISISDTGIGIKAENLDRIFTLYERGDNMNIAEGSGIGLPLAKGFVNQLNGSISVDSEYGEGSVFCVVLPITRIHPLGVVQIFEPMKISYPAQLDQHQLEIVKEADFSIVIAEDNPDLQQIFKGHFENSYNVLSAQNGREALELIERFMPDLVLSDVMMPELDGITLCKKLKANQMTSHIPILLITAKADQQSIRRGLDAGANDYITKPLDLQELELRIQNFLIYRRQLQDKYCSALDLALNQQETDNNEMLFLQELNTLIEENITDEIYSVRDIVKSLHTNKATLNKKLKYLTGLTISVYMRRRKLKYAHHLLLNTNQKINEICYAIGVKDPAYFTKMIKTEYGATPREIRNSRTN